MIFRVLVGSASLQQWLSIPKTPTAVSRIVDGIPPGSRFIRFELRPDICPDDQHVAAVFESNAWCSRPAGYDPKTGYLWLKFEGRSIGDPLVVEWYERAKA